VTLCILNIRKGCRESAYVRKWAFAACSLFDIRFADRRERRNVVDSRPFAFATAEKIAAVTAL
jgi:hypothetical protein